MEEDIPRLRIKWSEFSYYAPIRLTITDWTGLQVYLKNYLLINSEMEYKEKKIELCVPKAPFIKILRCLPVQKQKWIVQGKAVIELMKTYQRDHYGMRIIKVELIGKSLPKDRDRNQFNSQDRKV